MLNFDLTAYGIHAINTTIELCSLLGGILCPLPQYDFVGSATIPLPASVGEDIDIPGIGYWIPDLEATATGQSYSNSVIEFGVEKKLIILNPLQFGYFESPTTRKRPVSESISRTG